MTDEKQGPDITPEEPQENPNLRVIILVHDPEVGVIKFVRQPPNLIEALGMAEWACENIKSRFKPPTPKIEKPGLGDIQGLRRKH